MQDAFREVLQDIIYRRWLLAKYYRHSLRLQEILYGDSLPADLADEIRESEDLIQYLEQDKLFNPNRNLQVQTCTLRSCT
jgi:hypothetical protein